MLVAMLVRMVVACAGLGGTGPFVSGTTVPNIRIQLTSRARRVLALIVFRKILIIAVIN